MAQMCPNCSFDNPDDALDCSNCSVALRKLLGSKTMLSERYELVSVLGCGAMGAVYLAEDQRLVGRRCAIKENRPDPGATVEVQAQSREQFLAEANILARLDHPNLPKVSDYFIENQREYLVMDYVEGEDLQSQLERTKQPLPEDAVLGWADQVLDALSYLHNQQPQQIIHRDIKPANLRVNLQGWVKLVDFGLVKLLDSSSPETKAELRGLGTPAYAPLEQFAGSEAHTDARSDVYALGATLYHLLTNLSPPDVHQRLLDPQILLPPRELNSQLSKKSEEVILRAMEIHPDQRYVSAAQMREALGGSTVSITRPGERSVGKHSGSPIPIWLFGLIGFVLVLAILGTAFFILFRNQEENAPSSQQSIAVVEEQPAATPTEVVVQTLGDAPTDAPTAVVQPATPATGSSGTEDTAALSTTTPTRNFTSTSESTLDATPTITITSPPQISQPQTRLRPTLAGTIAYPVFNGTTYDLYLGQADGSGTQLFQTEASQPAFSADGSRIAFRSWRLESRGLMAKEVSGANPINLTNFVEDQLPTWSPDGTEIVLLSRRSGDRKSQLIKISSLESLGDNTIITEGEYPTIGLDGQLVFKGWGTTGIGLRLSTLALDDIQLMTDANEDTAPALSPDGQQIAFMSRRSGNWEIYIVNTDGSGLQRLTDDPAQDGLPAWSPDGTAVAFVSDRDGSWAVWAIDPTGNEQRQLFAIEGSPDGFVGTDTFVSRGWAEERISWTR